jgi:beta-lactam-binding protein with PASTA domain
VADESNGFPDEVVVPSVVGMVVDDARSVAQTVGLALAQPDPDGPPLSALTWRLPVVVTSQSPPAGTLIRRHHSVVVTWGSELGGVREPRRPVPRSLSDFAEGNPNEDPSEA